MKPFFNFLGEKSGKFCGSHQQEGMVNLQVIFAKRLCETNGCDKCACFAFAKTDATRYCGTHKQRGMIDVQNISCEFEGCAKRPNFNFAGIKKGRFCSMHKHEGMSNVVSDRRKERELVMSSEFR